MAAVRDVAPAMPAGCRACSQPPLDAAAVEALATEMDLAPAERSAPEELERRLAACVGCAYLSRSHTCLMCGCLVHLRALVAAARCPHPDGLGW